MMRAQLICFTVSGVMLLASISMAMMRAGWLDLDKSLFYRAAPILAPFLSMAVGILFMFTGFTIRSGNSIKILAIFSLFFICIAIGSMALGGLLGSLGLAELESNALSASFLAGVVASGFVLLHWCAEGLSTLFCLKHVEGR